MNSSTFVLFRRVGVALCALILIPIAAAFALSSDLQQRLDSATYVYIASSRKDGKLGKPAEIWFMSHDGAVYVGTPPTSWRVKRIKAGRPKAKIWVGKEKGGNMRAATDKDLADLPSFAATGSIVKDPKMEELLLDKFSKKYPEGWTNYGERFKSGFKDGSRVLVKYTPD